MDLFRQILGIGTAFALLGGVLWWLRRRGLLELAGHVRTRKIAHRLELAERVALTPQHSLFVVRVSDRALVLGASPQGFRVLANLPWAEMEKAG